MANSSAREPREYGAVDRSEAKVLIEEADTEDEVDAEALVSEFEDLDADVLDALAYAGIDGLGAEFSIGGGATASVGVDFTPRGVCILVITNSSDASQVPGPHFFAFSSASVGFGLKAGASGGIDASFFIDHYFGEEESFGTDREITAESYAAGSVAMEVEGDLGPVGGSIGLVSSQSQGLAGIANLFADDYAAGWQGLAGGIDLSASVEGGVEIQLTYAYAGPLEETVDIAFGRGDVRQAMEEAEDLEIREEGDWHFQGPTIGPSFLRSNVGERMLEE
ncbi:hypothetical protein EKH57_15575 [Halorubrum sp. BOL3-1]|uniref:hypothetical protein n=1 Tax=Halorubrum sp. BOL3-1 TaxID=2497325 RepID=UPI0010050F40|nr:hypothetical protein [Halorubrum sp. BOL3-1]QAU14011.1 hypothetical protein EKH57_15575 [Halorubrum sp. BOL3-1]